jgi:hypothetical protein
MYSWSQLFCLAKHLYKYKVESGSFNKNANKPKERDYTEKPV